MNKPKIKLSFAPTAFDNFEGTQEELDNLVRSIRQMVDSGEIFNGIDIEDDHLDELEYDRRINVNISNRTIH